MENKKKLLVIIPAHNEERNIRKVFAQLKQNEISRVADILVIDDASSDQTRQVTEENGYMLLKNRRHEGYGKTLQNGYRYAAAKNYAYVIQMDADAQHDPCNIPVIYKRLLEEDSPDIVLASRFMDGSSDFPVSVLRKAAYALFRGIICLATGRVIADPTTGLQGLNRSAFTFYTQNEHFDRYPDANMVIQMLLLGFRIVEIPAVMHARTDGRSMHHGLHAVTYMFRMFYSIAIVIFRIKVLKKT